MQIDKMSRTMSKCAYCGAEVIIRDIRDRKPQYCSRQHAAMARYNARYRGTNSGPMDRPVRDKTKEL